MNSDLIAKFSKAETRRGLRPRSVIRRRDVMANLDRHACAPFFELDRDAINNWLDAVPRVARTRHAYLSAVVGFYCWAISEELTDRNPAASIARPKVRPGLPRPMRADDLALAIHQAEPMVKAWLLLGALGGLRCQEIAGLERRDIWDHEVPALLHIVHGKGGVERVVPLHPDVLVAIRLAGLPRDGGPIFRNRVGNPFTPERVSQICNQYLRSIGIPATMHQTRHFFGTAVYRSSHDLRLTQSLMGHASPTTTAIYAAVSPLEAVAVVNGLSIG